MLKAGSRKEGGPADGGGNTTKETYLGQVFGTHYLTASRSVCKEAQYKPLPGFFTIVCDRHFYPHFTGEESEAHGL